MVGFLLLDLGHFGMPILNKIAAIVLIFCALSAWYMMATIVINDVAGREILKSGKPWIKKAQPTLVHETKKEHALAS